MKNIPVLILSCDKYEPLWDGFFNFYFKNFNFNQKTYLITEFKKPLFSNVKVINTYDHQNKWGKSLINALSKLDNSYVQIILEDMYIYNKVNKRQYNDCLKFLNKVKPHHLKYLNTPFKSKKNLKKFQLINRGEPYKVTVCGFWNRKYLINLLKFDDSPWDFEYFGGDRTKENDKFFYKTKNLFNYLNLVNKGKLDLLQYKKLKKFNYKKKINFKINTFFESLKIFFSTIIIDIIFSIDVRIRYKIIKFFSKLLQIHSLKKNHD